MCVSSDSAKKKKLGTRAPWTPTFTAHTPTFGTPAPPKFVAPAVKFVAPVPPKFVAPASPKFGVPSASRGPKTPKFRRRKP